MAKQRDEGYSRRDFMRLAGLGGVVFASNLPGFSLAAGQVAGHQGQRNVLQRRKLRQQIVKLPNVSNLRVAEAGSRLGAERSYLG